MMFLPIFRALFPQQFTKVAPAAGMFLASRRSHYGVLLEKQSMVVTDIGKTPYHLITHQGSEPPVKIKYNLSRKSSVKNLTSHIVLLLTQYTTRTTGLGPLLSSPVYTATKHGVIGFTRAMAVSSADKNFCEVKTNDFDVKKLYTIILILFDQFMSLKGSISCYLDFLVCHLCVHLV